MEHVKIGALEQEVFRIGLGTWAIGGWMWGGTEKKAALATLEKAFKETPINLIDTAPVYGFGRSEELCGEAIKAYGRRNEIVIATKAGLNWTDEGRVYRDSRPERIRKEVDDSLQRLQTDYIDILQIHWPDGNTPIEATAEVMHQLHRQGKIRAIGVCNYDDEQLEQFRQAAPLHTSQPPYNLFERGYEKRTLPYCKEHDIIPLTYGALCRGLLAGKMTPDRTFPKGDIRRADPKFNAPRFAQYLSAVKALDQWVRQKYDKRVLHLAVRWILDRPWNIVPLWGARQPAQLDPVEAVMDWQLTKENDQAIDAILEEHVQEPVGPEFMAPPERESE